MEEYLYDCRYLIETEAKFSKVKKEVNKMDTLVTSLLERHDSASSKGHRSTCYNLRLRISVTEGVRFMYVQYLKFLADIICTLRLKLFNQHVVVMDTNSNIDDIIDTWSEADDFEMDELGTDDDFEDIADDISVL
ncbi:hypothetical protein ACF0H5_018787 [Mactra antiquata]